MLIALCTESGLRFSARLDRQGPQVRFEQIVTGFLEEVADFHFVERELHHVLFHGEAVSEAETMRELRELMRRFIEKGVGTGEFQVTDVGFTADFLLQGIHGALVPILHEHGSDRDRFLVPARELARKVLVG